MRDHAQVRTSDPLDTNACSWSDGPVTNTCSIFEDQTVQDQTAARSLRTSARRPHGRMTAYAHFSQSESQSPSPWSSALSPRSSTSAPWPSTSASAQAVGGCRSGSRDYRPARARTAVLAQHTAGATAGTRLPDMHVCTRHDELPIDRLTAPHPAQERSSSKRPSIQVRRRRTLLGIAVIAMLLMLALPWGGTGGPSLATPGAARARPLVAGTTYVVRQGDTLWGIAVRLAGGSDPRPLVARLEAEAGGDDVHPGQQLVLP
jgi:hypothetical protein